jgi:uncharacterized membrane protein (DUF4010 family)
VDNGLFELIPKGGAQIVLVLILSFLIGIEREEEKAISGEYHFGGVRGFPLLGLLGYALCALSAGNMILPAAGFIVVGAFLWQSYRHKIETSSLASVTSEISGLVTYAIGALVWREEYWIATTLAVVSVLLLELKTVLENLSKRVGGEEIQTFAKFLLLTAVILPIVPNRTFGSWGFNPFRVWLVVAAVSAISYGSYVLQRWARGRGGVLLSALLGGAYSSTLTTVVLAKRGREQPRPHLYSGAMLVASGVMYLRLLALLGIFNRQLLQRLGLPFLVLAIVALLAGWLWSRVPDADSDRAAHQDAPKNPLELSSSLIFAGLFIAMLFVTHAALAYLGRAGLYTLAAAMGVTDVDPFILSLATSGEPTTPILLAAGAITIASASNNLVKGIYAYAIAERRTAVQGLILLIGLALLGLFPLFLLS